MKNICFVMTTFSKMSHCPECGAETSEVIRVKPKKHFHKECRECSFEVSTLDCPCTGAVKVSEI